jgi:hypothetical protein
VWPKFVQQHPLIPTSRSLSQTSPINPQIEAVMRITQIRADGSCPIPPDPNKYDKCRTEQKFENFLTSLKNYPESYDYFEIQFQRIKRCDLSLFCNHSLKYLLLRCRFGDDLTQCSRIMLILNTCPASVGARDSEGMTPLHYFCMRGKGACDYPILERLLEIDPDLPMARNIYGESPLHQLSGQNNPDPIVISALIRSCPQALKQTLFFNGRYPLHIVLSGSRLSLNANNIEVAKILMKGYPEAAVIDGECDVFSHKKVTPYKRAEESYQEVMHRSRLFLLLSSLTV